MVSTQQSVSTQQTHVRPPAGRRVRSASVFQPGDLRDCAGRTFTRVSSQPGKDLSDRLPSLAISPRGGCVNSMKIVLASDDPSKRRWRQTNREPAVDSSDCSAVSPDHRITFAEPTSLQVLNDEDHVGRDHDPASKPGAGGGSSVVRYPAQSEASDGLRSKFQALVSYSLVPVMLVGTIPLYSGLRTLFSPELSLILTATVNMLRPVCCPPGGRRNSSQWKR